MKIMCYPIMFLLIKYPLGGNAMNNITNITTNKTLQRNLATLLCKLDGGDITKIIISLLITGTVCYVCQNNGEMEITHGDTKVVVKSNLPKAA